jgi:hypothetical protein
MGADFIVLHLGGWPDVKVVSDASNPGNLGYAFKSELFACDVRNLSPYQQNLFALKREFLKMEMGPKTRQPPECGPHLRNHFLRFERSRLAIPSHCDIPFKVTACCGRAVSVVRVDKRSNRPLAGARLPAG